MTNKEKALEISGGYCDENPLIFKGEFNNHISAFKEGYVIGQHNGALEMADWKDQQFKEYLKKKYKEASNSYDKTEAKFYEDRMDYIDKIINELF